MKKFHVQFDGYLMAEDIDDAVTRIGINFLALPIEDLDLPNQFEAPTDISVTVVEEGKEQP